MKSFDTASLTYKFTVT